MSRKSIVNTSIFFECCSIRLRKCVFFLWQYCEMVAISQITNYIVLLINEPLVQWFALALFQTQKKNRLNKTRHQPPPAGACITAVEISRDLSRCPAAKPGSWRELCFPSVFIPNNQFPSHGVYILGWLSHWNFINVQRFFSNFLMLLTSTIFDLATWGMFHFVRNLVVYNSTIKH